MTDPHVPAGTAPHGVSGLEKKLDGLVHVSTDMVHRNWRIGLYSALTLMVLAFFGMGFTTYAPQQAGWFWLGLVPVFALVNIAAAWSRSNARRPMDQGLVLRASLHWLGVCLALWADFVVRRAGEIDADAAGKTALLLLSLGSYLSGVHFDWRFILIGLFLGAILLVGTEVQKFMWLLLILGFCLGSLLFIFRPRTHVAQTPKTQ